MKNDPLPAGAARPSALELAETLYKTPALLTTYTRCGKAHCHCAGGDLHGPYHALHWREGSVQRRRYVRPGEVSAVRAVIEGRHAARAAVRAAFADDLAVLRRLSYLRRELEAAVAAEQGEK